jgi:hypothetical protein
MGIKQRVDLWLKHSAEILSSETIFRALEEVNRKIALSLQMFAVGFVSIYARKYILFHTDERPTTHVEGVKCYAHSASTYTFRFLYRRFTYP